MSNRLLEIVASESSDSDEDQGRSNCPINRHIDTVRGFEWKFQPLSEQTASAEDRGNRIVFGIAVGGQYDLWVVKAVM